MDGFGDVMHMFGGGVAFYKSGNLVFRNRLNLSERINVLRQYERTPDINQLAQTFKCGRRQIKTILRKRKKYLASWTRRHKREPDFETPDQVALGLILNEWVCRARTYQVNVTDDILRNFAHEIAEHIRFADFRPSSVWLDRFKQKYNFSNMEPNIKQEADTCLENRKTLSINVIIGELRQQHGQSVILPNGDPTERNGSFINDKTIQRKVEEVSVGNFALQPNDSVVQVRNQNGQDDGAFKFAKEIATYKEALNQLGPLEQFALMKENIRAVGLINQLENLFREEMNKIELKG